MHFDRWRGQWVGQATTSSGAADATFTPPADAQTGAADITAQNYAQALNSISSSPAMAAPASSSLSSTTLLVGGLAAIGLIYFLTRK